MGWVCIHLKARKNRTPFKRDAIRLIHCTFSQTQIPPCPSQCPMTPYNHSGAHKHMNKLTGIQSLDTCIAPLAALVSFATWRSTRLPFLRDLDFPFVSSSDPSQSNCIRGHLRGSPGVGKVVNLRRGEGGGGGKKAQGVLYNNKKQLMYIARSMPLVASTTPWLQMA